MRLFEYRRAGAVVIDGDRVLLISMEPPGQRRWWHFPGGGIEEGETPEEAVVRELLEETGLRATTVTEYLRAGIHGGQHQYFLVACNDLSLGEVTGPELEYAAGQDFRAEWVRIAELASMPVFPRCVAEHLASVGARVDGRVPRFEDDRESWAGVPGREAPPNIRTAVRAVIADEGRIAAIERVRDGERYFTLPGGGVESRESVEEAVVRETREEVGLDVDVAGKLAVVVYRRGEAVSLQTYLSCRPTGGTFGAGDGDEYTEERRLLRGTYRPVWLDVAALPAQLKPRWLADHLPRWMGDPDPERPERFCEVHDL